MVRRRSSLQDSQITARYWEMNLPSYDKQIIKYVFLRYIYMHICWCILITINRVILTLGLFFLPKQDRKLRVMTAMVFGITVVGYIYCERSTSSYKT